MLRTSFFFALALLLLSVFCEPIDFDYASHGDDWDCPKNGSRQSPILLSATERIERTKESHLFGDYFAANGVANFLNTTIYITPVNVSNPADTLGSVYTKIIDGTSVPFKATEIRVRMHSEHKTEDGYHDLQLQVFHTELYPTSRNYRLAVGLLFSVGKDKDALLQNIIDGYAKSQEKANIVVDLRPYLPKNVADDFWFYNGSPTIPPCGEGKYHWVVSRRIFSLTAEQREQLEKILSKGADKWDGNWRNLQAQNSNVVGFRHLAPAAQEM